MSENITFSVSGSETYYHKDWLKSKGFKWVPSSKKWEKFDTSCNAQRLCTFIANLASYRAKYTW